MRYPTVGRYPNRVLEDEQFIEHGPPEPCLYCGADDCEGHSEAYVLAYLEEHPLGAPWEPGL